MLNVVGSTGIILGTIGMLMAWEEQQLSKRRCLQEIYQMFRQGKYALVGQRKKCTDFFKEYRSSEAEITEACSRIAEKLIGHEVVSGVMAWEKVWKDYMMHFHFSREEREVLLASGMAFFGKSMEEVSELFHIYQKQYGDLIEQSKKQHLEKRKVVMPVGVLGGIMLIILLI